MQCFEWRYRSRVVLGKLFYSLNTPKWGTWKLWPKNLWDKASWSSSPRRDMSLPTLRTLWKDAGVQDSDHLTAVAQQAQVAALSFGFALWCCGGNRVVVWGNPRYADCSSVQDQNLQQIQANKWLICSDPGRWIGGCLGRSKLRWRLLVSSRPAQKCAENSGHSMGRILRHLGRWICGCLGRWKLWWWLLGSSKSAQKCGSN